MSDFTSFSASVLLRRLHPRINNYNELLMFLLQCNMDIKYISSGPAVKALVLYIMDYITKSMLSVHAGLDAIKYVLHRVEQGHKDDGIEGSRENSMFVKSVNALMARQEMSHQQVMSNLIGGGDHYKSQAFVSVNWGHLHNVIEHLENGEDHSHDEQVHVSVDSEGVHSNDLVINYLFRPVEAPFSDMSFWEYAQRVEKMTTVSETMRLARKDVSRVRHGGDANPRGRRMNPRGTYLPEHPQHSMHMVRLRDERHVLSFVGHHIPHRQSALAPSTCDEWCRAMVALFKPWWSIEQLMGGADSWEAAFNATKFDVYALRVMCNMDVESEREDARAHLQASDAMLSEHALPAGAGSLPITGDDWDSFLMVLANKDCVEFDGLQDVLDDAEAVNSAKSDVAESLRILYRADLLHNVHWNTEHTQEEHGTNTNRTLPDSASNPNKEELLAEYRCQMLSLRKRK